MDQDKARALARRFVAMPPPERRIFHGRLADMGIDLALLPIPAGIAAGAGPDDSTLSHAQERLWFLATLDPDSPAYNMAVALRLQGRLDLPAAQAAIDALVARHPSLRTTFPERSGRATSHVHADLSIVIARIDLDRVDATGPGTEVDRVAEARRLAGAEAARPFDLALGPLVRVTVVRIGADDHVLLMTMHHIVSDGWSLDIVLDEFATWYAAHVQGRPVALPALPLTYADHARWQRCCLEAGELERQLGYWLQQLGGDDAVLELPADRPRPPLASGRGARLDFAIAPAIAAAVRALARAEAATPFMVLLAAWQALLARTTGQTDVRVGVPIANRGRLETEGLVGLFVNTQVLRAQIDSRQGFRALLAGVKAAALGAQDHQDLPFEALVDALAPDRSLAHNPIFQVMFNHQRRRLDPLDRLPDLRATPFARETTAAQFDLTLDIEEDAQGALQGTLSYATDLFDPPSIARLAKHFCRLLDQVSRDPARALGAIALLDNDEIAAVQRWNPPACAAPGLVHEWIAAQAAARPDAEALVCGDDGLSYCQLVQRSGALAQRLRRRGVGPETRVGLCIERSVDMVVGMLAVLEAGGAYVPLDPSYPPERLGYMMADAGLCVLLTQRQLRQGLVIPDDVVCLRLEDADAPDDAAPAIARPLPENLAYLIYTSGSTGRPKGVAVSHGAIASHCQAIGAVYGLVPGETMLQFASVSFDGAIDQWLAPLMHGARVLLRGPELWDADQALDLIARERVTVTDLFPAYLLQLAAAGEARGKTLPVRICAVGGEALPREGLDLIQRALRPGSIINGYGPTEAVVTPLVWQAPPEGCASGYAPIGRPIGQRTAYVLDGDLNLAPVGVAGELYLGGAGLARGYHGRYALTAERFVPDPHGSQPGARLYRTGDRARWTADGTVEYLGRADHQVKIRGFRIELGEIEAQLLGQPGVQDAVVVAQGDGASRRLIAYVVQDPGGPNDAGDPGQALAAGMRAVLPDYMVPAQIVALASLPRTPAGKVNRAALPIPTWTSRAAHVAPATAIETALAAIWRDVLGVAEVGTADNFFELGGDSIVSIQVVSRARQEGILISPRDIFAHQTVAALARVARKVDGGPRASDDQDESAGGDVPLLPMQAAFFAQPIPERHHHNQALLLTPNESLDDASFAVALRHLVAHHPALRMRFEPAGDNWRQSPAECDPDPDDRLWIRSAADSVALAAICAQAQRSLDLSAGQLLRAVHVDLGGGAGQRVLLVIHHLVVDGVSWRILLEDLQTAYHQLRAGAPVQLPPATSSLRRWGERLHAHARSAGAQAQIDQWQTALAGPSGQLMRDTPDGRARVMDAVELRLQIPRADTQRLLRGAPAAYRTQVNDLLLTALGRTIARATGQAAVLVELEGHGREDLFAGIDLDRTVGWFTSAYPVRLETSGDLAASIKAVKERLRQVPERGLGYGMLAHLGDPAVRERMQALPAARITFNYFGQLDAYAQPATALFQLAPEPVGDVHAPAAPLQNDLSINGEVVDGALQLRWTFSGEVFRRETITGLMEQFRAELGAIVEHCTTEGRAGATPSDFPLARLSQAAVDELMSQLPLGPRQIEDIYPLTPMQQGMLFHSLYAPQAGIYVNQLSVPVEGLDPARFEAAWQQVLARHEILRTGFVWDGALESPVQVVYRGLDFQVQHHDARGGDLDLAALAAAEHTRGFDLRRPPLMRVLLVRTGADRHHLIWTSHHLLLDGWSSARLIAEVIERYAGGATAARPAQGRYRDYLAWLAQQDAALGQRFWRDRLRSLDEPTQLASTLAPRQPATGQGLRRRRLAPALVTALEKCAQQERITTSTVVQGAWAILLGRQTGKPGVCFGLTVAGRPPGLPGVEALLGLFINTVPVVVRPPAAQAVGAWLRTLQADTIALGEQEHTPLYEIQGWAGQGGQPLFDSLIVFENYPVDRALRAGTGPLRFGALDSVEATNYPVTLSVSGGHALELSLGFDRALIDEAALARFENQLVHLLGQIASAPARAIGDLQLVAASDHAAIAACNAYVGRDPSPVSGLALDWVAARAAERPGAEVLVCGHDRQTYGSLVQRVRALAIRLRARGVGPEVRVGVCVERSNDVIVAMLAVMAAGGAFVPLDPGYPAARLAYIVRDAGMQVLVTQQRLPQGLTVPAEVALVVLDDATAAAAPEIAAGPWEAPRLEPDSLAYVIYTSGSTGRPKGVAVSHGAIASHCQAIGAAYRLGPGETMLQFASVSFDGAIDQWLAPLMHGAKVLMRGPDLWTAEAALATIAQERVTVTDLFPSYLLQLAEWGAATGTRLSVRTCAVGGEALPREGLELVRRGLAPGQVINGYGPTEAVVTPLVWEAPAQGCTSAYAPIGRPIGNRTAYVLDADLNLVPEGMVGELYLGGAGLARGYHGRPGLTADRFVPDPHGVAPGGRLYRTGDLARLCPDGSGTVEYLGRVDHQVKLRGFRIELGEIEAQLLALPGVREAVVVAHGEGSNKRLVAYLAQADAVALVIDTIKTQLTAALPDYMVPGQIVILDFLPRTAAGKIDRGALPAPDRAAFDSHAAPVTAGEISLAEIWRDVLAVETVGRDDDFFARGGHSLLAVRLVSKVKNGFGVDLSVRQIFETPVLRDLAVVVERARAAQVPVLSATVERDISNALQELDALSPDELAALLAGA